MEFIDLVSQQGRIREDLDLRIAAVLDHGRYVMGPEIDELEERLADYVGTRHCLAVSSGTDALIAAMMALEIGVGDEVITTPYTFIATVEAIVLVGAKPVFVDIDSQTWNIDVSLIESAITEKTKAIIPVGIYGQTADMGGINEIAARNGNLFVIEDAAQSFGATHHGVKSCGLSTVGCTSFFPSKPLGCYGDGGAVFTGSDEIAVRLKSIRNHGNEGGVHRVLGLNGRLDSIQAAVLLSKLDLFGEEVSLRGAVGERYQKGLQAIPVEYQKIDEGNTSVFAQFTLLSEMREDIRVALSGAKVPTMSYYSVPAHLQPAYASLGYCRGDLPVCESVAERGLSLPMNPYLPSGSQEEVLDGIRAVFDSVGAGF